VNRIRCLQYGMGNWNKEYTPEQGSSSCSVVSHDSAPVFDQHKNLLQALELLPLHLIISGTKKRVHYSHKERTEDGFA